MKKAVKEFNARAESARAGAQEEEMRARYRFSCRDITEKWSGQFKSSDRQWMHDRATRLAEAFISAGCVVDLCRRSRARTNGETYLSSAWFELFVAHLSKYAARRLWGWKPDCVEDRAPIPFNLPYAKRGVRSSPEVVSEIALSQDAAAQLLLFAGQKALGKLLVLFAARWKSPKERARAIRAKALNSQPLCSSNEQVDEATLRAVLNAMTAKEKTEIRNNPDGEVKLKEAIVTHRKRVMRRKTFTGRE